MIHKLAISLLLLGSHMHDIDTNIWLPFPALEYTRVTFTPTSYVKTAKQYCSDRSRTKRYAVFRTVSGRTEYSMQDRTKQERERERERVYAAERIRYLHSWENQTFHTKFTSTYVFTRTNLFQ